MAAALDTNPTTLEERSIRVFALGFAMKEFNKEVDIWWNLKVRFTKDGEITDIQDRVRPDILRSQTKMMKDLAEEK